MRRGQAAHAAQRSSGASLSPYSVLRVPSSNAVSAPESGLPPEARTPTNANCEAPVKISSDIAQVCSDAQPARDAKAPNDAPYTPVAIPTPRLSRTTARLS